MDAEKMNRLKVACDVQAKLKRMEAAAVEYAMACEALHDAAVDASAWCREEDCAELAEVSETLGGRLAGARDTARDLRRAAICVADGVIGGAMREMTDRERLEAWGVLIHSVVPEVDVMDVDGRMLAQGRRVRRQRSRRRKRPSDTAGGGVHV